MCNQEYGGLAKLLDGDRLARASANLTGLRSPVEFEQRPAPNKTQKKNITRTFTR